MTTAEKSQPGRGRIRKKMAGILTLVVVLPILCVFTVSLYTAGPRRSRVETTRVVSPEAPPTTPSEIIPRPLRVMTLNLAHGRKDGPNQLFCSGKTLAANIDEIAAVLADHKPDVIALQEADGPSIWSGNFNHVERLAIGSGMPFYARAENVKGLKLSYGTAIVSKFHLEHPVARTFAPSPPTFSKGYLVATIDWPERAGVKIDLVSVHLDFLRKKVRKKQVAKMIEGLSGRDNPLVVMGDFNCQWDDKESPVRHLADSLGLHAFRPEAEGLDTFGHGGRRLDWILVSDELKITSFRVLPDVLSDHAAVMAEIDGLSIID